MSKLRHPSSCISSTLASQETADNEGSAQIKVPLLVMAVSCGCMCMRYLDGGGHSCHCDQSPAAVCVLTEEHSRHFDVCVDELSGSALKKARVRCQLDLMEKSKKLNQWGAIQ